MSIDAIIDGVLAREGGYSDHPADKGGATMYGITEAVARANGYSGPMRSLPREVAKGIYLRQYVAAPGFAQILPLSAKVADELVDTGCNMGPAVASRFLQVALNALNNGGRDYPDLVEDGQCGPGTRAALAKYLAKRGLEGETVLLKALNALQGARYLELARNRVQNKAFVYGWLAGRVSL